jgi:putative endopeptidase
MSFAQVFRAEVRPAQLREAAMSDAHSADKFRVLGVLPNVDGWYGAFDVKPGDPHVPTARSASAYLVATA